MHKATQGPPLQATARLVALYTNDVPVALWPDAEPDEDTLVPIIRAHHARLRNAVEMGALAHEWMAAPTGTSYGSSVQART
jgi:TPP-dependent pyruvate/acetoin dehydrogenase alpha subunit